MYGCNAVTDHGHTPLTVRCMHFLLVSAHSLTKANQAYFGTGLKDTLVNTGSLASLSLPTERVS